MENPAAKIAYDIWRWQTVGGLTNFRTQLFDLFAKADNENLARLALAFPLEALIYHEWFCGDIDAFYEKYGVPVGD